MRNIANASILFFGLLVLPVALFAQGEQDFTLVNQTGVEIQSLFVSPTASDQWGEDILGQDTLPPGEEATIQFDREESECHWDFQVTDKEEHNVTWKNIDLCHYGSITLHMEGEKVWATFE